jgi:L-gulono-1,4-lactone dehydrogenase
VWFRRAEGELRTFTNFGGNLRWQGRCERPGSEADVLDILARHSRGHVGPRGAGHSWSDVVVTPDIALDMSKFDAVRPFTRDGETWVEVGAGCRLQGLLDRLHAATDRTLPTLGAIKRQTIAGAISTGTHGSGKQSLSHFVTAVRLAGYDAASRPTIVICRDGDKLRAARCALGAMGVILSVELATIPDYLVEETIRGYASLDDLLGGTSDHPLTHFILTPHSWEFFAWERRSVEKRTLSIGERLKAWFFRAYNAVFVDVLFHLGLKAALAFGDSAVKLLLRLAPRLFITGIARLDDAEHVLTLGHHYFRHEEMELFVPQSRLAEAVELLRCATAVFAGDAASVPAAIETTLTLHRLHGELVRHTGSYAQHYPFFFRRVLPEDTLISMASTAAEPYYSISVFTYLTPEKRQPYYAFCSWLARCMNRLFGARLHWGKHFPLSVVDIARLYPDLDTFRRICRAGDPNGVFGNDFTRRALGL